VISGQWSEKALGLDETNDFFVRQRFHGGSSAKRKFAGAKQVAEKGRISMEMPEKHPKAPVDSASFMAPFGCAQGRL
jgi:hypothetical protein